MMKSLMGLFLFCTAALAQAEICTVAIHDNYGFDYDHFTSESYSIEAACGEATWNCQQRLSYYQSYGRYYDAYCIVKSVSSPNYPIPYPPSYPPRYPTPRYPDPREPQYPRYPREPHDPRFPREPREPNFPREPREPNFPREPREPNFPREPRGPGGPGGPRRPR